MRYTVVLTVSAERELAQVWLASANKKSVTSAAEMVDALLCEDPESLGEVVFDTVRSLNVGPLSVEFETIEADRLVQILSIRGD